MQLLIKPATLHITLTMSVKYLVIDTNYVLNKISDIHPEHIYTTPDVIEEIKDEQSQQYLQQLDYFTKIIVQQPSQASLERVNKACIALGELGSVSK